MGGPGGGSNAIPLLSPRSCKTSERKGRGGKAEARSRGAAKEKTLECGQIVWGLAFSAWPAAGAGETEPACAMALPCLILATGLNDGQIKVWEVQTGERPLPTARAIMASGWFLSPWKEIPASSSPRYSPCFVPRGAACA